MPPAQLHFGPSKMFLYFTSKNNLDDKVINLHSLVTSVISFVYTKGGKCTQIETEATGRTEETKNRQRNSPYI